MTFPAEITTPPQNGAPVLLNRSFSALAHQSVYANDEATTTGLTWGYFGSTASDGKSVRWGGFTVAHGTLTLTASSTNYIVVLRSSGAISVSASSTNWDDSTAYARVYKITTGSSTVTATEDHRVGPGGVFGSAAAAGAGVELKGLTFTSDTGSTADSDPGAGLFKWNNATQASATFLYFDNATADGATVTTFWASLVAAGFIFIQQGNDSARWQLWKWTAIPTDGTGYRKFAVTLQANSASAIEDDKTCYVLFTPAPSTSVVTIPIACSDETTALTTDTAVVTFRMPYAMTLTEVRASVTTAPTGAALQVDINETGATVLSTKLTIDATEKTSTTAATPAVISDAALADDAEITIDIDAVGSTVAGAGLKVYLIGTRA